MRAFQQQIVGVGHTRRTFHGGGSVGFPLHGGQGSPSPMSAGVNGGGGHGVMDHDHEEESKKGQHGGSVSCARVETRMGVLQEQHASMVCMGV